jgi:hypothetical protein
MQPTPLRAGTKTSHRLSCEATVGGRAFSRSTRNTKARTHSVWCPQYRRMKASRGRLLWTSSPTRPRQVPSAVRMHRPAHCVIFSSSRSARPFVALTAAERVVTLSLTVGALEQQQLYLSLLVHWNSSSSISHCRCTRTTKRSVDFSFHILACELTSATILQLHCRSQHPHTQTCA